MKQSSKKLLALLTAGMLCAGSLGALPAFAETEGRRHFLEACRRDERMEYRAALDPEIDELLKN